MQKKSPIFFSFPSESTFDRRSKVELKEKKRRIVERRRKKEKNKLQGNGVKESTEIRKQGIIHY